MISRSALAAGASAAIRAGGRRADLRRDAWGHGLLAVAQAVTAAGAEEVIVDSPGEVEALRLEGITATTTGEPDLDPRLLYGLPSAEGLPTTPPVMRLVGRVMSTKRLRAGEAVSYGYTFRAAADTTVADVEIDGALHPIVGRVAMDVCVIDLQGALAEVGDAVTYFGGTGPASGAIARWAELTRMTPAELVAVPGAHAVRGWEA